MRDAPGGYASAMSGPDSEHQRPDGVSDATVAALGKLSEALEAVEVARGHLYAFHRLSGTADLTLGDAVEQLRRAGHAELADRIERELVGRNVLPGRWTFQIVEEYDDGYYATFKDLEHAAREALVDGKRHLYEAEMKEDRRTDGEPGHEATPADALSTLWTWRSRPTPSTTAARLPAIGFGTYPLTRRRRRGRDPQRDRERLPAARHGGELRERARGRRGDPAVRRRPRGAPGREQDPRPPPRVRRRGRQRARLAGAARPRVPRPAPHPLAQPERRQVRRGVAGAGRPARAGAGALDRRLELHRRAPRPDHRRDRRDAGGQPDRAAPVLPAAADARGQRGARHPHRVVEPARQAAGAVLRARGRRRGRAATASRPAR